MKTTIKKAIWRPVFWEPVEGTGERLMAGLIYYFNEQWNARRIIRDDILNSFYGKSGSAQNMIDYGLKIFLSTLDNSNYLDTKALENIKTSVLGLYLGKQRKTSAKTETELLRTSALMYSSLANMDSFEEHDDDFEETPE